MFLYLVCINFGPAPAAPAFYSKPALEGLQCALVMASSMLATENLISPNFQATVFKFVHLSFPPATNSPTLQEIS